MNRHIYRWFIPLLAILATSGLVFSTRAVSASASPSTPAPHVFYLPLVDDGSPESIVFKTSDPRVSDQWGLQTVNASQAWGITQGSSSVLIAVLDTGIDFNHPDLAGKIRTDLAKNYLAPGTPPTDDNGHGTHVAGIAAAAFNNGIGIAGLGGMASILPIKVLDSKGSGASQSLAEAIYYAVDHGAKVINMSFGSSETANLSCMSNLQDAINYAYGKGVVMVAAAGNAASNALVVPADCTHVLAVASTDSNNAISSFSNYGNDISVAAPGGWDAAGNEILSTWPGGGYRYLAGTSMATPLVSGLAALIDARYPTYTPGQVASAILDHAYQPGSSGWNNRYGCGRIDAYASLSKGALGSQPTCKGLPVSAASLSASAVSEPQWISGSYVPGRLVLRFQNGLSEAEESAIAQAAGASLGPASAGGWWNLQVPAGQEAQALRQLSADNRVSAVQPDYVLQAH